MKPYKTACLIIGRNFGDAVILSRHIEYLSGSGFADRIIIWTRPRLAFLFDSIPHCQTIVSEFPLGTSKNFGVKKWLPFLEAMLRIRKLSPDVSIDFVGDFRERLLARFVGSINHKYLAWDVEHPMRRSVRNPFGIGSPLIVVPQTTPSVYAAQEQFVESLTGRASLIPPRRENSKITRTSGPSMRVGIHPFASQPSRMWPGSNWYELVAQLIAMGCSVTAFAAPDERPALLKMLGAQRDAVRIVTAPMPEFAKEVTDLDLLIGHDSFSVHVASRFQVAVIMIAGSGDYRIWTPPGAVALAHSGGCSIWPCHNKPNCVGTTREFACIQSVSVAEVKDAVENLRVRMKSAL